MTIIYLCLTGLLVGVVSGMLGIGGGVVLIPILIFGFGLLPIQATSTSLVAMLLPVGALGVWQYYKAGVLLPTHFKMGLIIALGITLGSLFGAKLALAMPMPYIKRAFSVLLLFCAWRLWS
jgi:uncharacterized membrane protein YfcA